jgi:hypothetical protein
MNTMLGWLVDSAVPGLVEPEGGRFGSVARSASPSGVTGLRASTRWPRAFRGPVLVGDRMQSGSLDDKCLGRMRAGLRVDPAVDLTRPHQIGLLATAHPYVGPQPIVTGEPHNDPAARASHRPGQPRPGWS